MDRQLDFGSEHSEQGMRTVPVQPVVQYTRSVNYRRYVYPKLLSQV